MQDQSCTSLINYWLYHPDIYPAIKDDRNPECIEIPEGCVFHFYDEGMIAYHPSGNRMRIHPHILPKYRNKSKQIVMDSIEKINCELECLIPVCFRHIIIFAIQCGFKKIGKAVNDYLKDGIWYDSIYMVRK